MARLRPSKRVQMRQVLEEFCRDVEAAGGIAPNPDGDGTYVPVADEEWPAG